MKYLQLFFFSLIVIASSTACEEGITCNENDSKNLGQISYDDMNSFDTEKETNSMLFMRNSELLELPLVDNPSTANRWIDHKVCESLDIKPYIAYAYYEYENINRVFSNDETLLSIEPQILNYEGEELEVIYINLAHENVAIKGIVPVDPLNDYEPEVGEFNFQGNISINNQTYYQAYLYSKDNLAIYYSKDEGIFGISIDGLVYVR